ncbi:MAG: hypothetical protein HYU69_17465 [Bacteroidetes bacterium]|nr:hypothetical protein [Bacteroidota bacterium]
MIKICVIALLASTMIGCAPQTENTAGDATDSTKIMQESGPGCAELEEQVEHLNDEIAALKKELRKNSESSSHKKSSGQKTESSISAKNTNTPVKETAPVIKDQDKNASVRCSATDKNVRCKKRTFSPNGLCWQHGGN